MTDAVLDGVARSYSHTVITVPQTGYAKRGSKKRLLLSDLKLT